MKNLCKWGVVVKPERAPSGQKELIAAFMTKDEARGWLMMRVPTAKQRNAWSVEKLEYDDGDA